MTSNIEEVLSSASQKFLQQKESQINISNLQLEVDNSHKENKFVRDSNKNVFKLLKFRPQDVSKGSLSLYRCKVEFSLNKASQKLLVRVLANTANYDEPNNNELIIILHDQAIHGLQQSQFNDCTNNLFARIRKQLVIQHLPTAQSVANLLDYIPKSFNPPSVKATKKAAKKAEPIQAQTVKKNEDQVQSNNLKRPLTTYLDQAELQVDTSLYNQHKKTLQRGQAYNLVFKLTQNAYDKESIEINNKMLLQVYNPNVKKQFSYDNVQKLIAFYQ